MVESLFLTCIVILITTVGPQTAPNWPHHPNTYLTHPLIQFLSLVYQIASSSVPLIFSAWSFENFNLICCIWVLRNVDMLIFGFVLESDFWSVWVWGTQNWVWRVSFITINIVTCCRILNKEESKWRGNHVQVKMIGHIKAKIKNQNYSQFLELRKLKTYSSTRCELFPANFIFYNLYMPCTSYSVYRYIKKNFFEKLSLYSLYPVFLYLTSIFLYEQCNNSITLWTECQYTVYSCKVCTLFYEITRKKKTIHHSYMYIFLIWVFYEWP